MTPANLHAALDKLGLTQVGLAERLGVQDRTVRRWIAGEPIPITVELAIRYLLKTARSRKRD